MNDSQTTSDIAIVGGGICGLTTAIALEQRGLSPTVYEAASEYRPIGAGLLLQTNALLVFDRLGIVDRVRAAGVPLEDVQIRSPDGRVLQRFDLDGLERRDFGYGYVAIHRGDLQRILLDELSTDVETGMACTDVTGTESPAVLFDDGTLVRPDVLIGADGIDSEVRNVIAPDVELQALDSVVYRAIAEIESLDRHRRLGFEVWGDGTYTGGAPIASDRFYWFATVQKGAADAIDSRELTAVLRDRFAEFPDPVPSVLESLEPADVFRTDLTDVPSLDRWSRGSVVLAGDAAHGMVPFAGQGAAQAIEDALMLAHSIDRHGTPADAFEAYEAERKTRADRIRAEARRLGTLGTMRSSIGCRVRNFAVAHLPAALFHRFRLRRMSGTSLPEAATCDPFSRR
ncbi:FAD-dependent monooxygenase [Natrinema halophilum]|uniref:FAD-dependent monooxygenase n=1 Tax=Natrinema halophilum TaxID=1699371 RepID=A0A7D5GL15_9EURY|nr:FAD-dependent monooxygenase [Natrinema halophilum]QLG47393.1 FAD-dependent oxidoreductase [Natrinema halophilum]